MFTLSFVSSDPEFLYHTLIYKNYELKDFLNENSESKNFLVKYLRVDVTIY